MLNVPQFNARIITRSPHGPKPKRAPSVSRSRYRSTHISVVTIKAPNKPFARRLLSAKYPAPHYAIGRITQTP